MKNLKLFVFALCAVLLSVVTVNAATCNLPGETDPGLQPCVAKVNGIGYDNMDTAWAKISTIGGTFEIIGEGKTVPFTNVNVTKSITVLANGNTLSAGNVHVKANGSLTIENAHVTASSSAFTVEDKGTLVLNNVVANVSHNYVNNSGATTITGGEIKSSGYYSIVVNNKGNVTLNNLTKVLNRSTVLVNVLGHNTTTTINGGNYYVSNLVASPSKTPAMASVDTDTEAETPAKVVVNNGYFELGHGLRLENGVVATVNNGEFKVTAGDGIYVDNAELTVNGGNLTTAGGHAVAVANEGKTTIKGGTLTSTAANRNALAIFSKKATVAVSGGILESKGNTNAAAIYLAGNVATIKDGEVVAEKAYDGILTGGKYLNKIIAKVEIDGGTYDVTNLLVAKGYTVKSEDPYKVVVSTKASDETSKPGANKPGTEQAPNTFDAGLVYMGLALSAIGASVVSVRKLRNN